MKFIDKLVIEYSGIPNIIKDSRLPKHVVDKCFPEVDIFRKMLKDFDPKRIFKSDLSKRLNF